MCSKAVRVRVCALLIILTAPVLFGQAVNPVQNPGEFSAASGVRIVVILLLCGLVVFVLTVKRREIFEFLSGLKEMFVLPRPALSGFSNNNFTGARAFVFSPYMKLLFITLLASFFFFHLWNSASVRISKLSFNHYVYLADSFLRGRFDMSIELIDTVVMGQNVYSIFPPFPAVLFIPVVAFFGTDINVPLVSEVISIASAILLIGILQKLKLKANHVFWLVIAFFWGTGYWQCVMGSDGVWFFAHIAAILMILLAINEALGRGRGVLVGLFIGAAFLSRQLSIAGVLVLAIPLIRKDEAMSRKLANLGLMAGALGVAACIYLGYNWFRFGNAFDTGYSHLVFYEFHHERVSQYGLFHPVYAVFNFFYYFIQGFHVEFKSYGMLTPTGLDPFGTSFLWASPFIVFALWGKWKGGLRIACWISVAAMLLVHLLYFNNGWMQTNMQRFTLDIVPFLILLVAQGIKRFPAYVWKSTIAVAIAFNVLSMIIMNV